MKEGREAGRLEGEKEWSGALWVPDYSSGWPDKLFEIRYFNTTIKEIKNHRQKLIYNGITVYKNEDQKDIKQNI